MKKNLCLLLSLLIILFSAIGLSEESKSDKTTCLIDAYTNLASITNEATDYKAVIEDGALLIKEYEITPIEDAMKPITDFCNIGFVTYPVDGSNDLSGTSKAHLWGKLVFSDMDPYIVFMIDMKTRNVSIYTSRKNLLTTESMNSIIDNVYLFASNGEYGTCACETFSQILKLLEK